MGAGMSEIFRVSQSLGTPRENRCFSSKIIRQEDPMLHIKFKSHSQLKKKLSFILAFNGLNEVPQ